MKTSIKLTNQNLQDIYDQAKYNWGLTQDGSIDAHLWPAACYLNAFIAHLSRAGVQVQLTLPSKQPYETLED